MGKCVYLVLNEGEKIQQILKENGCELLLGDGKIDYDLLAQCDALVPGKARVTAEVLDHAPKLQIVAKYGVGMDRIDIDACTAHGVYAANTPAANFVSVAEHTVALMLASAKRICEIAPHMRREVPEWAEARVHKAIELSGKTVSIIGFGNIGSRVAKLLSVFDMNIIAYDPYIDASRVPEYVTLTRDLNEALSQGDFVTIHVAGTSDTNHLINKEELHKMKPNAILINTTRGFVINEADLIEVLQDGTIAGAALDVFTEEPIASRNPLMFMENVVATPHSAANTPEARMRAHIDCADNILTCFAGKRPARALNHPVGKE